MSRMGWIMLHVGYVTMVLFAALVAVAWTEFATPGDMSGDTALIIAAACIAVGGAAYVMLFGRLRRLHGRS